MQLTCPHCTRVLEFSAERPAFCGFCGKPLAAAKPDRTLEAETRLAGPTGAEAEADPEVVGGYRLLRRLGAGGMGTVYEAQESATGRRVALKLIAPHFAESSEAVQRFRQEGRLASTLAHPRCVFVLAADEEAGRPYIVMELMPGQTLKDLVEQRGPLPPEEAVAKVLDVIDGLREAHRFGVIHRDVKPSNCFVEANGRVKIGDFGLSRSLVSQSHLTRTGAFLGTPLYASPEQIRRDPLDPQTDVYSVAATLYYLLTGRAPHETGDAAATMARIVADDPPSVRSLRAEIAPALDRVVLRGLERQRERRWRGLDDFRAALLPFVPGQLSIGGLGIRLGATLIDYVLLAAVIGGTIFLSSWASGRWRPGAVPPWYSRLLNPLLWLAYLTVLEGRWGCSLGKWLLQLRVCGLRGSGPPGLRRALGRGVVWYVLAGLGGMPFLIGSLIGALPELTPGEMSSATWHYMILGLLFYPLTALGIAILACTMRARNGYRGLHEFLSDTRVVSLPEPERRRTVPSRLGQDSFHPEGLPQQVGPFTVVAALRWGAKERVLLAEDAGLQRKVIVWLRARTEPPLSPARRELGRPGRWRWLTAGEHDGRQWDAFLVSAGCSLPELIAAQGPLPWPDARVLLDRLTEELTAAGTDGTLPASLNGEQVWMQSDGLPQLLDVPLREPGSNDLHAADGLDLLRRVAVLALEGRPRPDGNTRPPLRAPLPDHAAHCLNRLLDEQTHEHIQMFHVEQAALRERPAEVSRARRSSHLVLLGAFLSLGMFCCMLPSSAVPGVAFTMVNYFTVFAGERAASNLEVGAAGNLLLAGPDAGPLAQLNGALQLEQDLALRERLGRKLEQARREREAYLASVGPLSRLSLRWFEEQMELQSEQARNSGRPSGARAVAGGDQFRSVAHETVDFAPGVGEVAETSAITLIVMLVTWPVLWVLWAFLARGGLSYRFAGLALVRADGRRASRLQCAWRALLVWAPVTALLGLSAVLEVHYWKHWRPDDLGRAWGLLALSGVVWWSAVALLPTYVVLALWSPARALHDRLAGTYLVPR